MLKCCCIYKGHIIILREFNRPLSTKKNPKSKYSNTVNLPVSSFPLWIKSKQRLDTDRKIEKKCKFAELYNWQRENVSGSEYVLHDGPPYANGPVHMGHAINKILKDITIRRKLLNGHRVHYKPGWDCHGLPIENKVLHGERNWFSMSPIAIRKAAKTCANDAIRHQKDTFKTWGILADWDNCYHTYDNKYIQNQFKQFMKLYDLKLIYRDLKPIYWSPSSRTALADAELEYNDHHVSKSIIFRVKLNVSAISGSVQNSTELLDSILYALVWTTTPWTIPGNQAIAYNKDAVYSLVRISDMPDIYLVASNVIPEIEKILQKNVCTISDVPGSVLEVVKYEHPIDKGNQYSFVPGTHVSISKGTGLVHLAPAHGPEDFLLGIQHKLSVKSVVDEKGCYTEEAGKSLVGLDVLSEGNSLIMNWLQDDILHKEDLVHSYPYDWRTKKPVIIRSSEQWFIDTAIIKENAIKCLENVKIIPQHNGARLCSQVKARPYWCISRQRTWGIPIPVLYDAVTDSPIINEHFVENYCHLVDKHGPDFWWILSENDLLPEQFKSNPDFQNIKKGKDILDIWLDSGLSWSNVLEGNQIADLYLEGVDQCTGWFQSSLMTSVAIRNQSPYKMLFVHGFAVDDRGKKMSKSIGNVVYPDEIIRGTDKKRTLGIDVFRWWVGAHTTQHANIEVADHIFRDSLENVQKLRGIAKFLLGVLNDFTPSSSYSPVFTLDKYMLHLSREYYLEAQKMYESLQYNKVCLSTLYYVTNVISGLYCHLTKDRLYCEEKTSDERKICQHVVSLILEVLLNVIAPITPHLVEEIYLHHPWHAGNKLYFYSKPLVPDDSWNQPDVADLMEKILELKQRVMQLKPIDLRKVEVHINAAPQIYKLIQNFKSYELMEIFQTASVTYEMNANETEETNIFVQETNNCECIRCRRFLCPRGIELCSRCAKVVGK